MPQVSAWFERHVDKCNKKHLFTIGGNDTSLLFTDPPFQFEPQMVWFARKAKRCSVPKVERKMKQITEKHATGDQLITSKACSCCDPTDMLCWEGVNIFGTSFDGLRLGLLVMLCSIDWSSIKLRGAFSDPCFLLWFKVLKLGPATCSTATKNFLFCFGCGCLVRKISWF